MHNRGSAIHLLLLMLITPEDDSEDTLHTPEERAAAAARSTWVSVAVNLVLTAVQIVVGILSKSQGLVADGIHSLSDLVADFVVLLANHHAKKMPMPTTPTVTSASRPRPRWHWGCCCWAWV